MMSATMVATKMANMCHACASKPAGAGMNQMTTPTSAAAISLIQLTSFFGSPFFCLALAAAVCWPNDFGSAMGLSSLLGYAAPSIMRVTREKRLHPRVAFCAFCLMEWGVINEGSEDGKRRGEGSANEAPDAR